MFWGDEAPVDGWERDVWLMARRLALLHFNVAQVLLERLGNDRGRELTREIIWRYGQQCGTDVGTVADSQGKPRDLDSFAELTDLPSRGWRTAPSSAGSSHTVTLCPLAVVWRQLGAEDIGRLYCLVDEAKMTAYNPEFACEHERNVLDGDDVCVITSRPVSAPEDE